MSLTEYDMYIDGSFVGAEHNQRFESLNPENNQAWATFPDASESDVERSVQSAKNAFNDHWSKTSVAERAKYLRAIGDKMFENAELLGKTESIDSGKLLKETKFQSEYMKEYFYYYADLAESMNNETPIPNIDKPNMEVVEVREPIGVVACIIPWNSQMFLMATKVAPALAAGNTVVMKSSELAPAPLIEFAKLVHDTGLPKGVINIISGGAEVGRLLTSHKDVGKILFTGGTSTASHVIRNSAENYASLTLELGGKSPVVVFDDADVENALNNITTAIFSGNGCSCIAGSVLVLQDTIYDTFLDQLTERAKKIKLGSPLDEDSQMGPLNNDKQVEFIEKNIKQSVEQGAKVICGGTKAPEFSNGCYFLPTIIECPDRSISTANTELFGPILSVIKFKTEEEALQIANDNDYGLSSGVFSEDPEKCDRVSKALDAGICFKNCYRFISYAASFGGRKNSGYGRESGADAISDMQIKKTIWTSNSRVTEDPFKIR
jgi:aldehyde dehydrogenase (NAD+)/betaine-aldehyde dehydrogenase